MPEEVFEKARTSFAKKDWKALYRTFDPQDSDPVPLVWIFAAGVMTMGDEPAAKELEALLDRHGMARGGGAAKDAVRGVKDKAAFFADLMAFIDRRSKGSAAWTLAGRLRDVRIEGDRARHGREERRLADPVPVRSPRRPRVPRGGEMTGILRCVSGKNYDLTQTGLKLVERTLVRVQAGADKRETLVADYELAELTDVRLKIARGGGDRFAIFICLALVALAAFGVWRWALPAGTVVAWIVGGGSYEIVAGCKRKPPTISEGSRRGPWKGFSRNPPWPGHALRHSFASTRTATAVRFCAHPGSERHETRLAPGVFVSYCVSTRRDGGTGRRVGFKNRWGQPHGGSIPPPGMEESRVPKPKPQVLSPESRALSRVPSFEPRARSLECGNLAAIALRDRPEREAAAKAANLIRNLGVPRGDRVVIALPPGPTRTSAFLGAVLAGAVPCLSTPEPRLLRDSGVRMAIVGEEPPDRRDLPDLWHVVFVGTPSRMGAGDFLWDDYYGPAPAQVDPAPGSARTPAFFQPSGAVLSHAAAAAIAGAPAPEDDGAVALLARLLGARPGPAVRDSATGLAFLDGAGRPLPGLEVERRAGRWFVRGWPVLEPRDEWLEARP